MKTIEEIESIIETACQKASQEGFDILPGWYLSSTLKPGLLGKRCCPLGAVARSNNTDIAKEVLGVSDDWIYEFITGFDRGYHPSLEEKCPARDLGIKFREKYPLPDYRK